MSVYESTVETESLACEVIEDSDENKSGGCWLHADTDDWSVEDF